MPANGKNSVTKSLIKNKICNKKNKDLRSNKKTKVIS